MEAKEQSEQLQTRRLEAGRLLKAGHAQIEVARQLGVAKSTVSGRAKRVEQGGLRALRARGLRKGALAVEFATELWTLPRVAEWVDREFRVRLSEPQIWRVLRSSEFSAQRPAKRALERDETAIQRWKQRRWPALKKTAKSSTG